MSDRHIPFEGVPAACTICRKPAACVYLHRADCWLCPDCLDWYMRLPVQEKEP